MDIEETLARLRSANISSNMAVLEEAIEAIEYLQNVVASMDKWIDDYAYDSAGFKF